MGTSIQSAMFRGTPTTTVASNAIGASPLFGFDENGTSNGTVVPSWSYGMHRYWDALPLQWPSVNTSNGVFTWVGVDKMLHTDIVNGITEVLYTLARTPPWASSNQTSPDVVCAYNGSAGGQGVGECYAPSDLNTSGGGTNAIWKAWVSNLGNHVNDPNYLAGTGTWAAGGANCPGATKCNHAHVRYYEIWNEPDDSCGGGNNGCMWHGSIAQLARLYEDARCTLLGSQGGRNVVHLHAGGISDTTATPCALTAIDPTAQIVMASNHGKGSSINYSQNQLYGTGSTSGYSFQLPLANPGNSIANATDIINEHLKPGAEGTTASTCGFSGTSKCSVETGMQLYWQNVQNILQPAEKNKPFWDDEMSYCPTGFFDQPSSVSSCPGGAAGPYSFDGNQQSFFGRIYLIMLTLGIDGSALYSTDNLISQSGAIGEAASQQAYNWLVGSTLSTKCTASGTLWTCQITGGPHGITAANGVVYQIMWDSNELCTSNTACPTINQTVSSSFTHFQDMTTASSPASITSHTVAIGIKPVVLSP